MGVIAVGFNTGAAGGAVSTLEARLARLVALGCDGAEITAAGLDAVIACRLVPAQVAAVREVMARHDLAYSMHAPIAINLMDERHADLHLRAAMASLELAAAIGAAVVVLHPGRSAPADWAARPEALRAFELDRLGAAADRAQALGLRIAYENISPNPAVIAGAETSYSLDPAQLADQLDALRHPAVVACLDTGHALQGATLLGFDMLAACARLAPHVGHIHFNDATGLPATAPARTQEELHFLGLGDMHAPPGLGAVDFEALARALTVLPGTRVVIELKANFLAHAEAQTLAAARRFGAALRTEPATRAES